MSLYTFTSITATGSAGSATGSTTSSTIISGRILGVGISYTGAPGTTVVTVNTTGVYTLQLGTAICTITGNTNRWVWPRHLPHSETGSTGSLREAVVIHDTVSVSVASSDPNAVIQVWLQVEPIDLARGN